MGSIETEIKQDKFGFRRKRERQKNRKLTFEASNYIHYVFIAKNFLKDLRIIHQNCTFK